MKNLLTKISFILLFINGTAQNATEAKMAFQMAEEKFDGKQYEEALEFLVNAETAYGSINPPMAFLKVMILNQISYATEKTDKAGEGLNNLEKALSAFDNTKGKEALGDDKLMDIYRIKTTFSNREKEYISFKEKEEFKNEVIENFLQNCPKLGIHLNEFLKHPYIVNSEKSRRNVLREKRKILDYFDDDTDSQPVLQWALWRKDGIVYSYTMAFEVNQKDICKNTEEFFGESCERLFGEEGSKKFKNNYYGVIENNNRRIVVNPEVYTSEYKVRRKGKKSYINYMFIDVEFAGGVEELPFEDAN